MNSALLAASKEALAYLESQWPDLPCPPETTEESALCVMFARLRSAIEEAEEGNA